MTPAGVEQIDAAPGQRFQQSPQFFGRVPEAGVVVLLLVLREAEHDRGVADLGAHRRHDLGAEGRAAGRVAAVVVGAPVGVGPQEAVDQITVPGVQGDAVEADVHGVARCAGEGCDHGLDLGGGHGLGRRPHRIDVVVAIGGMARLAPMARGPGADQVGSQGPRRITQRPLMPQLGEDAPARRVDLRDDAPPPGQGGLAVHMGNGGIIDGGGVVHPDPLGDDQPGAALGATAVVGGHVLARNAARREVSRHRRHDDAVGQGQAADRQRREQDVCLDGGVDLHIHRITPPDRYCAARRGLRRSRSAGGWFGAAPSSRHRCAPRSNG
ncbi:hypothetical protein D3C87_1320200 [compost metagenome]